MATELFPGRESANSSILGRRRLYLGRLLLFKAHDQLIYVDGKFFRLDGDLNLGRQVPFLDRRRFFMAGRRLTLGRRGFFSIAWDSPKDSLSRDSVFKKCKHIKENSDEILYCNSFISCLTRPDWIQGYHQNHFGKIWGPSSGL